MMTSQQNAANDVQPMRPRPAIRAAISVLLIVHIMAVFIAPWALDRGPLSEAAMRVFRPYVDTVGLNNGYRFFAPEPGPSHLIRYEVVLQDGQTIEGRFPDLNEQRPRLLYHRYFMLSEFANSVFNPDGKQNELCLAYARSYAKRLAHLHGAKQVRLFLCQRELARIDDVRKGMSLTDKSLLEEKPLYTYTEDAS